MHKMSKQGAAIAVVSAAATLLLATASWAAEVWVTNMKSADVYVIDPESRAVIAKIPAQAGAHNVTFSADGKLALVANVAANSVTIIDAVEKTVIAHVPTGGPKTHEVSVSPDGKLAAASNVGGDTVTLIDIPTAKVVATITTDQGAMMSVFSPDASKLYVVNAKAGNISVVDVASKQVTGTMPGG